MGFDPQAELSEDVRSRFYIGGQWRAPESGEVLDLISPMTEETTLRTPAGSPKDMAAAVRAARQAFDASEWPRLTPQQRAGYLDRLAGELRKRESLFQRVWTAQVGAPQWFATAFTGLAAAALEYYARLADAYPFEDLRQTSGGPVKVVKEPVGVAALILPWNAPLVLLTQKLGPALLAGCTTVIKPSPETPLDALILAECAHAAGMPPGVVNVVPAGRETGDWLIRHPDVDKVGFTGSTAAGKHIAAVCADRLARVSLELGGKSASILCEDADLDQWLSAVAPFTMPFSGQICFSQTRVLVPKSRHDEVVDAFASAVGAMVVGDPWDAATQIGPVSMARQRDRVMGYIETGKREGARVVIGGGGVAGLNRGYYVAPTIFDQVTNDMTIAREEIFGPVVSVLAYDGEEEAVQIANDSTYGLSGTVFSSDVERAERIARRIRTGSVGVNGLRLDPSCPFGGYKQSGLGRECGPEGLLPFLESKSIYLPA